MTDPTRRRGFIYGADLQWGRKLVLIVSADSVNTRLREPIGALLTETAKVPTMEPTYVEIEPPDGGVKVPCCVQCHFLLTLDEGLLAPVPQGDALSFGKMQEVERKLMYALNLSSPA